MTQWWHQPSCMVCSAGAAASLRGKGRSWTRSSRSPAQSWAVLCTQCRRWTETGPGKTDIHAGSQVAPLQDSLSHLLYILSYYFIPLYPYLHIVLSIFICTLSAVLYPAADAISPLRDKLRMILFCIFWKLMITWQLLTMACNAHFASWPHVMK